MKKSFALAIVLITIVSSCTQAKKYKILSCGIRHESNTFSTITTGLDDCRIARGQEVLDKKHKWSEYLLSQKDVELIPTTHAYAWPGGVVETEVYELVKSEILEGIKKAGKLDGIFMDMHGALHVQGYPDAQADLIRSIRELVGNDVVISGSFDLHGNVSDGFVSELDLVTAYRTAPHRDGEETKLRAVRNMMKVLRDGLKPMMVRVEIPLLVPGEKSVTEVEPFKSICGRLYEVEKEDGIMDASIFIGYAWADLLRSAMRVFVVAEEECYVSKAKAIAESIAQSIWDARKNMVIDVESGSATDMIKRSYELPQMTVFISDSGDNTTAGASGDNPQMIKNLLDMHARNAFYAGLVDPEAFGECLAAGEGAELELELVLGGRQDYVFGSPLTLKVRVLKIADASILVESDGLKIAILNKRDSFTTLRQFAGLGLDPLSFKVVVVKLGYLYPELRDIAPVHLMALTSGFCNLDMCTLPYKNIKLPAYPLDSDMRWTPISSVL